MGSAGWVNFPALYCCDILGKAPRISAFLNISPVGQPGRGIAEPLDDGLMAPEEMKRLLREYPGVITGLKVRLSRGIVRELGIRPLENAVRLGECALISKNTPIRQSGILFFNTLYDENASCHLALGTGFPECLQGGLDMTKDEIVERGVNQSAVHVDFMIGSDDLSIVGIADDGTETKIFVNGQWVWE